MTMDEYANLDSLIHRWDARCKQLGLTTLIFGFATVNSWQWLLLMLAISSSLYMLSKLPLSFLIRRLRYPSLFVLGLVVMLPFVSGQTIIWQIGPLAVKQEGCLAMLLITGRFVAIMTLCLVMFSTNSMLTTVKALQWGGMSPVMVDMILLSYRYLFELDKQLKTMATALRLRGFKSRQINQRNLSIFAALAGTLFVRSYEQSEQVYKAMRLRGYGSNQLVGAKHSGNRLWGENDRPVAGILRPYRDFSSLVLMILCMMIGVIFMGVSVW